MKRVHLKPQSRRIWHRINAGIATLLIVTGIYLRLHGIAALKPHDPVLLWHEYLGFAMLISTVLWHVHAMWSENPLRHYGIVNKNLKSMSAQARYYIFLIFSGALMYIFMLVLGTTGLLFLDIPPVRRYLLSEHLVGPIDAVHAGFSYLVLLVFIVHLYLAALNLAGRGSRK